MRLPGCGDRRGKWADHEDWLTAQAAAGLSAGAIAPLASARLGAPVSRAAVCAACWRLGITLMGKAGAPMGGTGKAEP
ncbi:hypothetical protein [Microbaculum marinisediminis]|uniref:hypothetical protein n=1 Tax=Microbaculum marinisediminis TaxID=2931392 RepID=UPI0021BF320D|nr:hypothetical protein [Microbaculum sp. A6E488]